MLVFYHLIYSRTIFSRKKYLEKKFNINLEKPLILLIQHPVTWQIDETKKQINETLAAIAKLKIQTIAIYPCSDPGFSTIITSYKRFTKHKFFKLYKNIEINEFYSLLKYSSLLIGNQVVELQNVVFKKICTQYRNKTRRQSIRKKCNTYIS